MNPSARRDAWTANALNGDQEAQEGFSGRKVFRLTYGWEMASTVKSCFFLWRNEQAMTSTLRPKSRSRFEATDAPVSWNGEKLYSRASPSEGGRTESQGKTDEAPWIRSVISRRC